MIPESLDLLTTKNLFKRVLSGSFDKAVKLWKLESGKCIKTFIHTSGVTSVKQATNNKLISGCYDGSIKIWDVETSECITIINARTNLLMDILSISNDRFIGIKQLRRLI